VGQPLLTFMDEFISSLCGVDDGEIEKRWADAFEDGRIAVQTEVQGKLRSTRETSKIADDVTVHYSDGSYVVVVPSAHAEAVQQLEVGTPTQRPRGLLRTGVARGCTPASKAITDGLEMP
jgi:hypothetical protein